MEQQTKQEKCLEDLKVYYGLEPYEGHISNGSGTFYYWLKCIYSDNMIKKCEEILNVRK